MVDMANFWMVRAGEAGFLYGEFERQNCVAIGWDGDYAATTTLEDVRAELTRQYPDAHPGAIANWASIVHKFRTVMQPGDRVVTYDPKSRQYLLGKVTGDYEHAPGRLPEGYDHVRPVTWEGTVHRDDLGAAAKNSLGSTLTLFEPGDIILAEMDAVLRGEEPKDEEQEQEEEFEVIRDTLSRAHEFIKDRIRALSPDDMEVLIAALLRAMGYKTRVTPKGPDRGRDVLASPDGLGFQQPRIFAEVKHRPRESMGAQTIRGFAGGLRSGDRGLFVSTGGYTKEAKYEAERASVPITLVDLDDLATLIVEYYESFDSTGRALLPLIRVYWPASRG